MSHAKMKTAEEPYYRVDITRYPALSTADEIKMFEGYRRQRTPAKLDQIVKQYLYWAADLACRYCGPRMPKADAISAANLGLMQAISTFDPSRGRRFVTHSYFAIRRQVLQALYQTYDIDPEPGICAARHRYNATDKTSTDREKFDEDCRKVFSNISHTEQPGEHDEFVESDSRGRIELESSIQLLRDELPSLPDDLRHVIELRYFSPGGVLTFIEVARRLHIAPDRARWLHGRGLKKLRELLKSVRDEI